MNRDLEIKPLIVKEEDTKSPAWSVLNIFEIILVSSSVCTLPVIEDDCEDSPLRLWATLMTAIGGAHIGVFTLERIGQNTSVIKTVHLVMILILITWLAIGHYWVGAGISCRDTSDFLISLILVICFDVILVAIGSPLMVQYCKPKEIT